MPPSHLILPRARPRLLRASASLRACVSILALSFLSSCATQPLPPVHDDAPTPHLPGKFVWHALMTDDVAAAERFYGGLLGWTFSTPNEKAAGVRLIRSGSRNVGAIVEVKRTEKVARPSQWLSFISVPDVKLATSTCAAQGTVYRGPMTAPGLGELAIVADPLGAPFGLIKSENGDPPDGREPSSGEWIWRDYLASNPAAVIGFYSGLVGMTTVATSTVTGDVTSGVLEVAGKKRAGMAKIDSPNIRPNWLPHVRVENTAAAFEKAKYLGGGVVFAPHENMRKGSVAVVTDPRGAAIALQQYPF